MSGKPIIFAVLLVLFFSGCSTNSFIFGQEKAFCEDCEYQYKGVCANPIDIYYNSDLIMSKKEKCTKKTSKRKGVRK